MIDDRLVPSAFSVNGDFIKMSSDQDLSLKQSFDELLNKAGIEKLILRKEGKKYEVYVNDNRMQRKELITYLSSFLKMRPALSICWQVIGDIESLNKFLLENYCPEYISERDYTGQDGADGQALFTQDEKGNLCIGPFNYYLDYRLSTQGALKTVSYDREKDNVSIDGDPTIDLLRAGFPTKELVNLPLAWTEYNPFNKAKIGEKEISSNTTATWINTYVAPKWHKEVETREVKELPPLFKKLVWHLIPGETDREFFFHWLYMSLFKRAYTYLILCGDPGIGKNRLKLVMRALHGFSNSVDGKKSTLTERFNSQIDTSTLVWFDELKYTIDNENILKEIQNSTISIERKGIDATKATRIYCSMVISNNKERDNYIAYDARKFAPLDLTNDRLEVGMTTSEISELTDKVEDENSPDYDLDFVADIAIWVKNNCYRKKWENCEYKGKAFWRIAAATAPVWQRSAIDLLYSKSKPTQLIDPLNPGVYKWTELAKILSKDSRFRRWMPDNLNAEHFFKIYRDLDGKEVFKVRRVEGNNWIGDFYIFDLQDERLIERLKKIDAGDSKINGEFVCLLPSSFRSIEESPASNLLEEGEEDSGDSIEL